MLFVFSSSIVCVVCVYMSWFLHFAGEKRNGDFSFYNSLTGFPISSFIWMYHLPYFVVVVVLACIFFERVIFSFVRPSTLRLYLFCVWISTDIDHNSEVKIDKSSFSSIHHFFCRYVFVYASVWPFSFTFFYAKGKKCSLVYLCVCVCEYICSFIQCNCPWGNKKCSV